MICTRCDLTGWLNLEQVDEATLARFLETGDHDIIFDWLKEHPDSDVSVCDCCGDGTEWYGIPGLHDLNNPNEPFPDCY